MFVYAFAWYKDGIFLCASRTSPEKPSKIVFCCSMASSTIQVDGIIAVAVLHFERHCISTHFSVEGIGLVPFLLHACACNCTFVGWINWSNLAYFSRRAWSIFIIKSRNDFSDSSTEMGFTRRWQLTAFNTFGFRIIYLDSYFYRRSS